LIKLPHVIAVIAAIVLGEISTNTCKIGIVIVEIVVEFE
jgi:hypothetical protein